MVLHVIIAKETTKRVGFGKIVGPYLCLSNCTQFQNYYINEQSIGMNSWYQLGLIRRILFYWRHSLHRNCNFVFKPIIVTVRVHDSQMILIPILQRFKHSGTLWVLFELFSIEKGEMFELEPVHTGFNYYLNHHITVLCTV